MRDIPTEVELDRADGMPTHGAAGLDHIFTLGVDRFVAPVTTLSEAHMDRVCAAYRFAAGCRTGSGAVLGSDGMMVTRSELSGRQAVPRIRV